MKYSFALSLSFLFSAFCGFSQIEISSDLPLIRDGYRGCAVPISCLRPTSCSGPIQIMENPEGVQNSEASDDLLDITDPEMVDFGAAPNPTKGQLIISVAPVLLNHEITVYDMTCRQVGFPVTISNVSQPISIEGEAGIYIIAIPTNEQVLTKRILLE